MASLTLTFEFVTVFIIVNFQLLISHHDPGGNYYWKLRMKRPDQRAECFKCFKVYGQGTTRTMSEWWLSINQYSLQCDGCDSQKWKWDIRLHEFTCNSRSNKQFACAVQIASTMIQNKNLVCFFQREIFKPEGDGWHLVLNISVYIHISFRITNFHQSAIFS